MIRLLFLVVLATLIAYAITSLHAALSGMLPKTTAADPDRKVSLMPAALKTISYGLLLALMFGIVTGWIGG